MRDILHCDLNNFFASVECIEHPEYKGKPLAVGGNSEDRHGVVVAANYEAKKYGVKCGVTVYQATKLCPNVILVESHHSLYEQYSAKVQAIYRDFTDLVEVCSIDECWLDVTESHVLFGTNEDIALKLRERVKKELGLTISVGVSFTKVFAKIGSDLKKPDATTIITPQNFKDVVWPLSVSAMLGAGNKTTQALNKLGINTIGDLACSDKNIIISRLGKTGEDLYINALGKGDDKVVISTLEDVPKSVGNSTTFYKDLTNIKDIRLGFSVICENIVQRMIGYNLTNAATLQITVKDSAFNCLTRQTKLPSPCRNALIFTQTAINLFKANYPRGFKVRLLGVSVTDFNNDEIQLSLFESGKPKNTVDEKMVEIRKKYGHDSIKRANALLDARIAKTFDDN